MSLSHCYNSSAADQYAHDEGKLQDAEDARESYIEGYTADQIKSFSKQTLRDTDGLSLWHLFSERQAETDYPLNDALTKMLAVLAVMPSVDIDYLRTLSSPMADAAKLIQQDIETLLGEEASGDWDQADASGDWESIL